MHIWMPSDAQPSWNNYNNKCSHWGQMKLCCIVLLQHLSKTQVNLTITNSPNSAPHSSHVTLFTGWILRDKCLDSFFCFSVVWIKPGLPTTANLVLSKHSLDCMHVHPVLSHVTNSVWCPPLLDRITSICQSVLLFQPVHGLMVLLSKWSSEKVPVNWEVTCL